jgi:hypothetical protein
MGPHKLDLIDCGPRPGFFFLIQSSRPMDKLGAAIYRLPVFSMLY